MKSQMSFDDVWERLFPPPQSFLVRSTVTEDAVFREEPEWLIVDWVQRRLCESRDCEWKYFSEPS